MVKRSSARRCQSVSPSSARVKSPALHLAASYRSIQSPPEDLRQGGKIQMVLRYAHPSQVHQTQGVERLKRFVTARRMEGLRRGRETTAGMIQ
jgi:hypothetical protein